VSRHTGERLPELEREYGLSLDARQRQQVSLYLELLGHWNRQINLTAIHDPQEQLRLGFMESFWVAETFLEEATALADVGSGAGFPGIPLKIYRPSLRVTLLESNQKKAVFLKEACRRLGLPCAVWAGRAEDYPGWEGVELAVARALKPSAQLLERLVRSQVRLLLLQGAEEARPPGFRLLRQARPPGARRRRATLWGCRPSEGGPNPPSTRST
jgi:16S rRNA (guanine527-N7)-methyltransferase